jgi:hypothetical protein
MPQVITLLKDHGAHLGQLLACSLETLEELAEVCGAAANGLLHALLEDRGPQWSKGWDTMFLAEAARQGRWLLLQRMLWAQPDLSVSALQAVALNAAGAGQSRLLESCLARVPTTQLPGVADQAMRHVANRWSATSEGQVSHALLGFSCLLPPLP